MIFGAFVKWLAQHLLVRALIGAITSARLTVSRRLASLRSSFKTPANSKLSGVTVSLRRFGAGTREEKRKIDLKPSTSSHVLPPRDSRSTVTDPSTQSLKELAGKQWSNGSHPSAETVKVLAKSREKKSRSRVQNAKATKSSRIRTKSEPKR